MDEKILINQIKLGHLEHYEELIRIFEDPLYKYCCFMTGSTQAGQDLFQDTWVKVMKNIDKYSEKYSFKNWLLSIANNTYKDSYRKKKRWTSKIKDFFDGETMDREMGNVSDNKNPEQEILKKDDNDYMKSQIMKLKETLRSVILLYYFQEKSIKEISYILNIPEGTVKSRLNTAKKSLKKTLEVRFDEREKQSVQESR